MSERSADRAVSAVLGEVLMIALVVLFVAGVGVVVIGNAQSNADDAERKVVDARIDATRGGITIAHRGGESVATDELRLLIRNESGAVSSGAFEEGTLTGTEDGTFEVGEVRAFEDEENFTRTPFPTGTIEVTLIHEPTEDILERERFSRVTYEPVVSVERPNGGEVLSPNQQYTIRWDAFDDGVGVRPNTVNISYSTDGGSTWTTDETGEANDGTYRWEVPDVETTNALVRVNVSDRLGKIGSDTSDETFEVVDSTSPTPDNPPNADAGGPYDVQRGSTVGLDGTGSNDPNSGDTISYSWTIISGPGTLTGATTATPTYDASGVSDGQSATVELTVTAGGESDTDRTTIDIVGTKVEDGSTTGQIQNGGNVVLGDNSTVTGQIKDSGDVTAGENTTIDGNIQNNGDITAGDNATVNGQIKDNDDVTLGNDSTVSNNIQNNGDVTAGDNTTVNGQIKDNDDVTLGNDSTVTNGIQGNDGNVIIGARSTVEGQIKDTTGYVIIGEGATIEGNIQSNGDVYLRDNVTVTGQIKDNGVVYTGCNVTIEGQVQNNAGTVDDCGSYSYP